MLDFDTAIAKLEKCELIKESEVKELCEKAKEYLIEQGNIMNLSAPVTVCGDIHGQFYDLLELFTVGGKIPDTNYLFLGDFVDRGHYSIEVILLLLLYMVRYSNRITLLRGNHESRQITQVYGFYDDCLRKYGSVNVWKYCCEVFDLLPIAALIGEKVFCVHGGISMQCETLDTIRKIDRKMEVPQDGPICDMLWSDPEDNVMGFVASPRGAGYLFGGDEVAKFLQRNKIDLICRAHQLVSEGYKEMFNNTLCTIWSAPNYCYHCGNVAAILEFDEYLDKNFKIFHSCPDELRAKIPQRPAPEYFL
mmetsp:Transcript_9769/g.14410  ORF Transcript_9769/g.14410 Transcript_9769/m.14410 type:complete len:306 (+) Transcript_9769:129-1046(+)